MAMRLTFNSRTMDIIMYVVRQYSCEPARAIELIIENPILIDKAKYAQEKAAKKLPKT
jgi:hypothetical protein